MAKAPSRPERWASALKEGQAAVEALDSVLDNFRELREEYEEWKEGLPENLQDSPTAEKLEELVDSSDGWLDELEAAKESANNALADLEQADLPRGFGRD